MKQDCPLCRKEVFEMSYSDSIQEESVANEVESSRSQQPNRAKNKVKNKNDLRYVKELIKENAELDKYSDQTENRDFTNNFSVPSARQEECKSSNRSMRILMSSRKHEEPLERRYKSRQNKRLDQTISDMNSSHSILNQPKSIYDDEKKAISRKKKKKVRKVKKIKRKTKAKADKAASHGSKNLYNNEIEQDAKSDGLILNQIFDSTMSFKDSTKSYKVIKKNTILEKMTHKDISKNESKRSRKQSNLISGSKSSLKNETRILPFEKPSEADSIGPKEDNV